MKNKKTLLYLLGIAFAVSLAINFISINELKFFFSRIGKHKVTEVLDGDSFVIPPDQIVRLDYLNAPELGYCYGEEAKKRLTELIDGKYVRVVNPSKDSFKRIMAEVYVDDVFVNQVMVGEGYAKYQRSSGGEKRDLIKQLSSKAKDKQIGVWSSKCYQVENINKPECNIKGNIGKSDGTKTYHFPGCSEYERTIVELDIGEQWFCTEEEAQQAGYAKATHCP
jgi:endonuclease YncB( thermonuclease family)